MLQYAEDESTLKRCFPTIQILRPHLTEQVFLQAVREQRDEGYRLAYLEEDGEVVACAGFRFSQHLAWGKVIYIDDLVTWPEARGQGHAGTLLSEVVALAYEHNCDAVHLDSGYHRQDAHRLYLNEGFVLSSHHFARSLKV